MNTDTLKKLGFETATKRIETDIVKARKMNIAYQNFDFVSAEDVNAFKEKIKKNTLKEHSDRYEYDTLVFYAVKDYKEAPPQEALEKMGEAVELKCFDYFEIAKIESVVERKDPILFGRIDGCGDLFFIAQWDNDVTIDMIREAAK